MESPKTYSEWIEALDIFIKSPIDYQILEAFKKGSIDWQGGCADRFVNHFLDAINSRIDDMNDRVSLLSKSLLDSPEQILFSRLCEMKKEFTYLKEACELPFLPDDVRENLVGNVVDVANQAQESLEDSCKADRTGKLLVMTKNNAVNNF